MSKNSTTQKKPKVISGVPEKVTHVPPLTIKKLADKLVEIEKKEGYQMALVAVECLNYQEVCKIACDKGKDNDPHLMPSRFMILYGATDEGLKKKKNLDKFPHELHDDIDEEMSVERLRYYLGLMGYYQGPWRHLEEDQDEDDDSDAEEHDISATLQGDLFGALCNYIKEAQEPFLKEVAGGTYTAKKAESLSDIADRLGIRNWRILLEMNEDKFGATHDIVPEGAELKLPDSTKLEIKDWLAKHKWDDQYLAQKGYQYPGKYMSLSVMKDEKDVAEFEAPGRKFQIYLTHPRLELVLEVLVKKGDELDFVIPDTPHLCVWLEGYEFNLQGKAPASFEQYSLAVEPAMEAAQKTEQTSPGDPHRLSWGEPDEDEEDDDWFKLPDFDLPDFGGMIDDLKSGLGSIHMPSMPDLPKVPDLPKIPDLPPAPKLPDPSSFKPKGLF